jgi:DNA-binding IclR family transcriptional regulator
MTTIDQPPEQRTPASMLDRVVEILDVFTTPGGLTLTQVVARTNLPRSSTHRILEHLVRIRWMRREGFTYHLGLRMLELGTLAAHQHELRAAAAAHLHELHIRTGLVVHLAVLDGSEIVYLERVGGSFGMRVPSRVGGRAPAHCTGAGKAMLAFADEATVAPILGGPMPTPTSLSIGSAPRLRTELDRVRERGIAFDREESVPGIGCVGAPIGTPGSFAAAISVSGPISRVPLERMVAPVRATAHKIAYALSYSRRGAGHDVGGTGWPSYTRR